MNLGYFCISLGAFFIIFARIKELNISSNTRSISSNHLLSNNTQIYYMIDIMRYNGFTQTIISIGQR